ncbi:MAG TPA: glycosyltransferase family 87 protein [Gemmatales bacterium]|nr:glycosyltransferase family 87 protein [Gemmatales bacterium]
MPVPDPAGAVPPSYSTLWLWVRRGRAFLATCGAVWLSFFMLWNTVFVDGDVSCDFAGQWLMGRVFYETWWSRDNTTTRNLYLPKPMAEILAKGFRPDAYASAYKPNVYEALVHQILRKGYPRPTPPFPPKGANPVWEPLLPPLPASAWWPLPELPWTWLETFAAENAKLIDPIIEGPLYPPTAGLIYMPIGMMSPKAAHAVVNVLYLQMAVLCGWLLTVITRRRLVWAEGTLLVLAFPNTYQAILLGQNSVLSLTILLGGWALFVRQRPILAGLVWGLFAYKPVFAVALLLVPIALLQLRLLAGMVMGGGLFVLLTLPFTGIDGLERFWRGRTDPTYENAHELNPWERWLVVGQHATMMYAYDRNWIWMSRDLRGLARRKMWSGEDLERWATVLRHRYFHGVDFGWKLVHLHELPEQLGRAPDWPGRPPPPPESDAHDPTSSAHWDPYLMYYDDGGGNKFWLRVNDTYWDRALQRVNTGDRRDEDVRRFLGLERTITEWMSLIGNALLLQVVGITLGYTWLLRWRRRRAGGSWPQPAIGLRAAFLVTGAIFVCPHFMHYDLLLFLLPVALVLAEFPVLGWGSRTVAVLIVAGLILCNYDMSCHNGICRPPFETFLLLFFWAWTGLLAWGEAGRVEREVEDVSVVA